MRPLLALVGLTALTLTSACATTDPGDAGAACGACASQFGVGFLSGCCGGAVDEASNGAVSAGAVSVGAVGTEQPLALPTSTMTMGLPY